VRFNGGGGARAADRSFQGNVQNVQGNRQQLQHNRQNAANQYPAESPAITAKSPERRTQYQQNRQNAANQYQQNRQNAANQYQQNRQNYAENAREDWQDYCNNRNCGYGGYNYYYRPVIPRGRCRRAGGRRDGGLATRGCTTAYANGVAYQNCGGTYYQPSGSGYVVVAPPPSVPVGTTVAVLPAGATTTTLGGVRYYVANGVYYRPYLSEGRTVYVVSQP